MSKLNVVTLVTALTLGLAGCYHATIDTGRAPSGHTVERQWAHGFVYGLVPPSLVETASQCAHGVAKVETQLSFLNQVANVLTFGLYTPMTITVRCAAPGMAGLRNESGEPAQVITVRADAEGVEIARALDEAADQSASIGEPVFVQFVESE
jgi:hypothetical protein